MSLELIFVINNWPDKAKKPFITLLQNGDHRQANSQTYIWPPSDIQKIKLHIMTFTNFQWTNAIPWEITKEQW